MKTGHNILVINDRVNDTITITALVLLMNQSYLQYFLCLIYMFKIFQLYAYILRFYKFWFAKEHNSKGNHKQKKYKTTKDSYKFINIIDSDIIKIIACNSRTNYSGCKCLFFYDRS